MIAETLYKMGVIHAYVEMLSRRGGKYGLGRSSCGHMREPHRWNNFGEQNIEVQILLVRHFEGQC